MINMWSNYRDTFPTRYIEEGYFDKWLSEEIEDWYINTALDIGGGTEGTQVLNQPNLKVSLLDPFVDKKPDWMYDKVDWDTTNKYDLIVCRGSVNYLTIEQLKKIKTMLNVGGEFIFNTFVNPPPVTWTERPYKTLDGVKGTERSKFNPDDDTIQHELISENGDKTEHIILYYAPILFKEIFHTIQLLEYRKNSMIGCYINVPPKKTHEV